MPFSPRGALCCTRAVQLVAKCRQSPYLHKPAIVIVTSFSLLRPAPTGAGSPRFHYDVILIMTSFATQLTTPPAVTDVRTDTLPRLTYKDAST